MCGVPKHVPRLVLFNDFDLAEHLSWVQNMHSESNGRAESIAKHNTSWTLGIRSLPEMMSKSSRIKLDETSGPRFMPPLSYSHWYFFSIRRRSTSERWCYPRAMSTSMAALSLLQNRLGRSDFVPWRCRYHTSCIILVCAMADPRVLRRLKTLVFWQEIRFISRISIQQPMQRDQFPSNNEGRPGRAILIF